MQSLDDIFKGKEAPVVEQQPAEAPKVETAAETPAAETTEQKAARERDERGRFVAKQEGQEAPKAEAAPKVEKTATPTVAERKVETKQDEPQMSPREQALLAKSQDEKRKRQDLERRLADIEARNQPQQPKIDPVADPEGFAQRIAERADQQAWNYALNLSEAGSRRLHGNELVDEAKSAFQEALQANPGLWQQLRTEPDPYDFVVKWHKREKFLREVNDPDEWTKKQTETIRQQLEAEYAQKQQPARQAPPTPPPSLAAVTSTERLSSAPVWNGPPPLNQIVGRR